MNNDVKSGIGYVIPFGAIIGFFTALFLGEFLISIVIAIAGILVWFLYMVVMESSPPSNPVSYTHLTLPTKRIV